MDRELFRSEGHIPYDVTLSPGGRYASFLEVVTIAGTAQQRLMVIDGSGHPVRGLVQSTLHNDRGLVDYTWCCDSMHLAVITGPVGESSRPIPESLHVIDVRTGATETVDGIPRPLQVSWAPFDSSLYILSAPGAEFRGKPGPVTRPVYRYHVPTRRVSRTTHRGIYFSEDGKYYVNKGYHEGEGFWLYRTADDREVTQQLKVARHHLGADAMWAPGTDHTLVVVEKPPPQTDQERQPGGTISRGPPASRVKPDRWNLLVDAQNGRVIERFQGDIAAGWATNARMLAVERRRGIELVPGRRP